MAEGDGSGVGWGEEADGVQEGGFAAAAVAAEGEDVSGVEVEGDVFPEGAVAVAFGEVADVEAVFVGGHGGWVLLW